MPPIDETKIDWTKLAERLRTVAEELRQLSSDRPSFFEEMEELRREINTILEQLRPD